MSVLPLSPLPTGTVKIAGKDVPIRSLSREQARRFVELESPADEAFAIACATGCTEEEATEWMTQVDFPTGSTLILAVLRLSGLTKPEDPEKAKDPTPGSAATS